ncbi:translation initiation factor IF-2-like isoform X1 [Accipiter gentilis]|uniref:translation initiation factor IF-2-like isoform X1 n=1 Tax=Astur gentilis TaxID=8957 RepID=UPI00210F7DF6|nr:translation initiation factor IF-2-like isoform X1 [Accipiter gentilis]XP_049652629.1 translation initiation factor IF-2-like isoform X1 [Accipiter gentilis]XP_049652630.1 translation initiation factor IF-2-like isoform X1 [Accipiter gentilis]XP_049652631.1 translation initiation factor IF-2-like isoform X1 [Accipiter gentilis]XP_049652632.1 translation initiation factor IF-2-like isoform X1 [Accipiter gentilis]
MAEEEPLLPAEDPPEPPGAHWRNGAAFWILGLCNNLPYVLMLSAARDILDPPRAGQVPPSPSPPQRLPLRLQPPLHRGGAVGRHPPHAPPQNGGSVPRPPPALQLPRRRRRPLRLGRLRPGDPRRRRRRQPGGRGVGQRRVGAGGGHLPGARRILPQGGRGLLVLGDGRGGAGRGAGVRGAAAGGAAPPPRPAAGLRPPPPHPPQLLLPAAPPAAPHGAPAPRRGADAGGEVEGGEGRRPPRHALGRGLFCRILHQPGAAGAAVLPRLRPDPRRAVPLVPAPVPGRRFRLPLLAPVFPPPPRLGPRPPPGPQRRRAVGRRGRPFPPRLGRGLRHRGRGGGGGRGRLRQRPPQRGRRGAARGAGVRHDGGVAGRHDRDRAGRGRGAGRAPPRLPRPALTRPRRRKRPRRGGRGTTTARPTATERRDGTDPRRQGHPGPTALPHGVWGVP